MSNEELQMPTPEEIASQDKHDLPDVAPVIDICDVEGGGDDGNRS